MAALASALMLALHGLAFAPHYRLVGHHGMVTNGRYTVLWSGRRIEVGTLIDEQTGRRIRVILPGGCRSGGTFSPVLGSSWLLAECGHRRVDLYSLSSDEWRGMTLPGTCRNEESRAGGCVPLAVGTDWIEYDKERSARLGDRFIFQKLDTGALRGNPTGPRTLPDLDSPVLAQPVCAPLRVPRHGTLTFDGRYAVAAGATGTFIERCGSRLHLPVPFLTVATGPGAIVWLPSPTSAVSGVFLPSLRRFKIAPPPGDAYAVDVEVSLRHIYITMAPRASGIDVWSAPAPRPQAPVSRSVSDG
ncbi:MAG TPA: hypothetical protein VJ741_12620 [Solirubrobacteraceae bacterium]|nr:hypothetical protein [Solirubrobacteraceae bacterium]